MFCRSCGAEMPEGVKFCTKCGTPMPARAAQGTIVEARTENQPQKENPAPEAQKAVATEAAETVATPQPQVPQRPEPQVAAQPKPAAASTPGKQPAPKKSGGVASYIALGLAAVALVLAIVGLALPNMNKQEATPAPVDAAKIVAADTTTVTIKAGETIGRAKLFDENNSVIVVGTSAGGDSTFSDVMYDQAKGEIYIIAKKPVEKETKRDIMWVAFEK